MRDALREEWGWAPRGSRWILPAIAIAAGVAAGGAIRRRMRRKRKAT